ncbi:S41 family peptidase [Agarilytica rhodophyticola]|uniref:S41 family peptidase n=1 Tax=Agarilytica rhodophyticola TaxID=1737490 RepID=UPI003CCB9456
MGLFVSGVSPAGFAQDSKQETENGSKPLSVLPLEDLRVFTKAYDQIRNAYVKEIDDRTLLEHAIRGMLDELDPHSTYLDASSFEDLQVNTTGEFGGLGIEVGIEDGFVKVIAPIDDTPAARGGVEAGDLIIKLDGVSVKGLALDKAVEKMRGPKGSDVTITIVREGVDKPIDLTLTRDTVKVRSVRSEIKTEQIGYIRIAQFQLHTGDDVAKEFAKLMSKEPDLGGIILDLRNNPGGVLQASVDVVDHFLEEGLIVYTEGRLPDSNSRYEASPGDISKGMPIVVLINDGSASASEIVAGALQDHGRALILGTRSFGKGSVQSIIQVTNDRALKLTTALYFTPNGRSIQAEGIEPDIQVERVRVTAVKPRSSISEAGLSGHLENASKNEKNTKKKSKSSSNTDLQNTDSQLYEAITMLRGLNLLKQKEKKEIPNNKVASKQK